MENKSETLIDWFDIKYPIIMAPMFLVTNTKMVIAAFKAGIIGCIPALNYRGLDKLEEGLKELQQQTQGKFGINLIVHRSNGQFLKQLDLLAKYPPAFVLTSLGSPKEVIEKLKPLGVKILCDVINTDHARKVENLGADALVAVNSDAGGHLGIFPAEKLVNYLKKQCSLPIISAGGIGDHDGYKKVMELDIIGLSVGSPFIATTESDVDQSYKQACVDYGRDDIVVTRKISGTPCTVINTPYMKELGNKENFIEKFLNKNKTLKKYVKMIVFKRGMNWLSKAAFSATYKSIWCAGPSIEHVDQIRSVQQVVNSLTGRDDN